MIQYYRRKCSHPCLGGNVAQSHWYQSGAPNDNFRENICSEDDLRSRIFGTFAVKFLACLPLLGFSTTILEPGTGYTSNNNKLHELQNVVTMKACDVLSPDVSSPPGEQKSSGYTQSTLLLHHYQLVTNFRCYSVQYSMERKSTKRRLNRP